VEESVTYLAGAAARLMLQECVMLSEIELITVGGGGGAFAGPLVWFLLCLILPPVALSAILPYH
jgi:hypothetical protein